jgi:signal transduction histidine kinase/ligand-binding sensor domain-containing protein
LLRLHGGQLTPIVQGLPDQKINALVAGEDNTLWIGTDDGVSRWNGVAVTRTGVPAALAHVEALAMLRDRDDSVWIGTASGALLRVNRSGVASVDPEDRVPRGAVTAIFEDRDRNLWIGTNRGIERLRDGVFTTYSTAQGLPPGSSGAIHVDIDRVWVAPVAGGLYTIRNRQVTPVQAGGLAADVIYSISGDGDDVWFARQRGGLTRLHRTADGFEARTFTRVDGLSQDSVYAVYKARDGAVWAGTLSGGLNRLADGRFTTFTMEDGLPSNTIAAITESAGGTIWVATPNGASQQQPKGWNRIGTGEGLPSNNVNTLFEDSKRDMWIGTAAGLALFRDGRIRVEFRAPDPLRNAILGIGEDRRGALWIATSDHILSVNRDRLGANAATDADVRVFDGADGLLGVEGVRRDRSVAADSAGRVWISTTRGLSMADPDAATGRTARALVAVESVSADGAVVPGPPFLIPARTQRIAFTFTGLSLGTPERVLFRYRLDRFDPDWSAPSSLRQATYTNLGPGKYRFQVVASNGDGNWDGEAGVVALSIAPAVWQTTTFRVAVLAIISIAAWGVYRLRLLQVQRRLGLRFDERLAERTRIAQDLHDTLLQGFLSASMQLHAAAKRLPADSSVAPALSRVLDLMQRVIVEGRNAVRGLRSADSASDDLERAFSSISDELNDSGAVDYRVVIEGHDRPLQPFVRDEIYRIGREAVSNAFRHASATEVELALEYGTRGLQLRVRDNGRGIETQVVQSGTDGHWGLPGMRERAERMGADFRVWSNAGAGTEIEMFIPAKIAFRPEKQRA